MVARLSGAPDCACRLFCPWLAAHFLPLPFGVSCPRSASCPVAMSCASLQLNSRCWLRLRTPSRSASPGLWAPLVLVAPLVLPTLAHPQFPQRPQRLRWCLRLATRLQRPCCAPRLSRLLPLGLALAPAPCAVAQACTASQFQHRLWLAWFGCSRGVGTGHGLGHQELPASPASPAAPIPRLSRFPCRFSRLADTC